MPSTSLHVFGTTSHWLDPAFPISWDGLCDPVNCREGEDSEPSIAMHKQEVTEKLLFPKVDGFPGVCAGS